MSEKWKPIDGYDNYLVSNLGRIKNSRTGRVLRPWEKNNGYLQVRLCQAGIKKNFYVHRLVALHFVPNPNGLPEVNPKKGLKHDNRATELEWVTHAENQKHAWSTGLVGPSDTQKRAASLTGKKCSKRVNSPELDREFASVREAARQTGLTQSGISACCNGRQSYTGKHPVTCEKLTWRFSQEGVERLHE